MTARDHLAHARNWLNRDGCRPVKLYQPARQKSPVIKVAVVRRQLTADPRFAPGPLFWAVHKFAGDHYSYGVECQSWESAIDEANRWVVS